MSYDGYTIEQIEDAIIDTLSADDTLLGYVRTFDRFPWELIDDEDAVSRFVLKAPALLTAYAGGRDDNGIYGVMDHFGEFAVCCIARNLRVPSAALSGPVSGEKGVYDMLSDVLSCLNFSKLGLDINSCISGGIAPLFVSRKAAAYARNFTVCWRYTHSD